MFSEEVFNCFPGFLREDASWCISPMHYATRGFPCVIWQGELKPALCHWIPPYLGRVSDSIWVLWAEKSRKVSAIKNLWELLIHVGTKNIDLSNAFVWISTSVFGTLLLTPLCTSFLPQRQCTCIQIKPAFSTFMSVHDCGDRGKTYSCTNILNTSSIICGKISFLDPTDQNKTHSYYWGYQL